MGRWSCTNAADPAARVTACQEMTSARTLLCNAQDVAPHAPVVAVVVHEQEGASAGRMMHRMRDGGQGLCACRAPCFWAKRALVGVLLEKRVKFNVLHVDA